VNIDLSDFENCDPKDVKRLVLNAEGAVRSIVSLLQMAEGTPRTLELLRALAAECEAGIMEPEGCARRASN